jgi:hypothetical protein
MQYCPVYGKIKIQVDIWNQYNRMPGVYMRKRGCSINRQTTAANTVEDFIISIFTTIRERGFL